MNSDDKKELRKDFVMLSLKLQKAIEECPFHFHQILQQTACLEISTDEQMFLSEAICTMQTSVYKLASIASLSLGTLIELIDAEG